MCYTNIALGLWTLLKAEPCNFCYRVPYKLVLKNSGCTHSQGNSSLEEKTCLSGQFNLTVQCYSKEALMGYEDVRLGGA